MLETHDLAARRGDATLFRRLSFAVAAGKAMVVTGPERSAPTGVETFWIHMRSTG